MPEPRTAAEAILACLAAADEAMTLRDIVGACCRRDEDGVMVPIGVRHKQGYSRRSQYVYQMALGKLIAAGKVDWRWARDGKGVNRYRLRVPRDEGRERCMKGESDGQ